MAWYDALNERARRIFRRRGAYRRCFLDDHGEPTAHADIVLKDLALFCDAYRSTVKVSPQTGAVDPLASGIAQGRREVFLRIQAQLRLKDEAVLQAMETES